MKTVFVSVFQDDAIVLASILNSVGIQNELLADRMLDVNPLFSTDVLGVQIVVSDDREEEAKVIVEDYRAKRRARPQPVLPH
ncbi:MAG: hypothetical protein NT061_09940 [Spirochaetes bacterium]|nr:hypothetical protein [Spirochaetota bacterium]